MNEADDDRYVSIGYGRYKEKGKEKDDDADVYVKTDSGKFVKSSDQKSDDDGGKKPEEPQGGKLGGSDFDRDANRAADDEADDMDRDARFDADAEDDDEADAKDNKHDISSHPFYRYYDSGANKGDDIEISDANSGPIDMDDIMDMLKKDPKIVGKMGDDVYFDGEDLVSSKFDDDTIGSVKYNMTLGDLKKQIMAYEPEETEESIKVIDGKKYKAIKESGKTINVNLKEKYDEIFRSLK